MKFDIDRYVVEGNTLLKPNAIGRVLRSFTGKQKDFADVQRALEALQGAYQNAGWGVVQVTLPEQELERGEVRFDVIETRIGKVEVQGNEYFSEANVRRSVPSLNPGETPNSLAIARSLKVANENPAKQSQVSFKSGSKDGEVDAIVKVVDENPRKYSVGLDNTGTSSTGVLPPWFRISALQPVESRSPALAAVHYESGASQQGYRIRASVITFRCMGGAIP